MVNCRLNYICLFVFVFVLFVPELHTQREVSRGKDDISSQTPVELVHKHAHAKTVNTRTHDCRLCWERNELQLTAGGKGTGVFCRVRTVRVKGGGHEGGWG